MQNGSDDGLVTTALDEYNFASFLDKNKVPNGGIVESYSFLSMGLDDMFKMSKIDFKAHLKHYGQDKEAQISLVGV